MFTVYDIDFFKRKIIYWFKCISTILKPNNIKVMIGRIINTRIDEMINIEKLKLLHFIVKVIHYSEGVDGLR